MTEIGEDWCVPCSDDENYGFNVEDEVLPPNQDIIEYYTKLSKGEKLSFEWQCIGRRPPTPEVDESSGRQEEEEEQDIESSKNEVTEFDFDEPEFDNNPITPKRTPGSTKAPKSQKRVARLDKIMNDMFRHKQLQSPSSGSSNLSSQRPTPRSTSPRAPGSPRGSPKPSANAARLSTPAAKGASPKTSTTETPGTSETSLQIGVQNTAQLSTDSAKNRMSPKKLS